MSLCPAPTLSPSSPSTRSGTRRERPLTTGEPGGEAEPSSWSCSICRGGKDTPQRRSGPEGPLSLCNACGLRWGKDRRVPHEFRDYGKPGRDRRMAIAFLLNDADDLPRPLPTKAIRRRISKKKRMAAADALLHFMKEKGMK